MPKRDAHPDTDYFVSPSVVGAPVEPDHDEGIDALDAILQAQHEADERRRTAILAERDAALGRARRRGRRILPGR